MNQPYGVLLNREYLEENVFPYMIGIKLDEKKKIQGHWTVLVKRVLLNENHVRYCEALLKENDHRFMVNAFAYANTAVFVEGQYYHWIKRKGSNTSSYSPRFWNFLSNFALYEELFGRLYNFQSQEKITYNVTAMIDALEYVLLHYKDCNAYRETVKILKAHEVKQWMEILQPEKVFQKQLKRDVLNGRYTFGFIHSVVHYLTLRFRNLLRKFCE